MESLIVNRNDLVNNIQTIQKYVKDHSKDKVPKIIGVVKANGYGLDVVQLSKELINQGIDILAVSEINEAIKLRNAGINNETIMLSSTSVYEEVCQLIENDVTLTVGSINSLQMVEKVAKEKQKNVNIHVKIETGFSRHGIKLNEIAKFIETYNQCENVKIVGMFTHFINSFADDRKIVDKQYKELINAVSIFRMNKIDNFIVHICNSCAIFKYPEYYLDAVRVGSALTGRITIINKYGLRPLGELETVVSEIKEISKGSSIGYSNMYKVKQNTKIGIIQTGYSSGIGLDIKNNTWRMRDIFRNSFHIIKYIFVKPNMYVIINKKKCKIIGNIRMNNIIIDITDNEVSVGDKAKICVYPVLVDSEIERKYI